MHLMNLPDDVLEKILSYVSFDEVSRSRLVSQRFNEISKRVLNHGYHKVENYHAQCLKKVKSQLPRRESERRNHPLARHCDILTAIETRLSLLGMTFKKFIDLNYCCFIPGKVLDEIYGVLRYVNREQSPVRAHEVMQELRDLSSMAMEHFDEKIAPVIKKHKVDTRPKVSQYLLSAAKHMIKPSTSKPLILPKETRMTVMAQYLNRLARKHNKLDSDVNSLRVKKREMDNIKRRVADLEEAVTESTKKMNEMEKTIAEQQMTITGQGVQLNEQKLKVRKLTKMLQGKPLIDYDFFGPSCSKYTVREEYCEEISVCEIQIESTSFQTTKRKFESNLEMGDMAKKKSKK